MTAQQLVKRWKKPEYISSGIMDITVPNWRDYSLDFWDSVNEAMEINEAMGIDFNLENAVDTALICEKYTSDNHEDYKYDLKLAIQGIKNYLKAR